MREALGTASRGRDAEVREARDRLARTEARLAKLVDFIAEGNASSTVAAAIRDLEHQAKVDRAAAASLEAASRAVIVLPSPEQVANEVLDLEKMLKQDPVRAREELRSLFGDGLVRLEPQADGHYLMRAKLFPLVLMLKSAARGNRTALSSDGSGGRI